MGSRFDISAYLRDREFMDMAIARVRSRRGIDPTITFHAERPIDSLNKGAVVVCGFRRGDKIAKRELDEHELTFFFNERLDEMIDELWPLELVPV